MTFDSNPAHSRREFLGTIGALVATGAASRLWAQPARTAAGPKSVAAPRAITIYKDPNCGCCKLWVAHMQKAGFIATVNDTTDMATVKSAMGVPEALQSCHTARIGSYTIEGHVPADVIIKLLDEKPEGRGLAVPGMPSGSPGMEGGRVERYAVLLFDKLGKSRVYASR